MLESCHSKPWVVATTTIGAGIALYGYSFRRNFFRRSVSFTSIGMVKGPWPPKSNVGDPTINAACFFENDAPTFEAVVEEIVKPLLEYKRLSHVFDLNSYSFQPTRPFLPKEMVREVEFSGGMPALKKFILQHAQDSVRREGLPWWEVVIIRNRGDGPSACVIRIHHCLGDGLSLASAFQTFVKTVDGQPFSFLPDMSKIKRKKAEQSFFRIARIAMMLVRAAFHVTTLAISKYDNVAFAKGPQNKHSGQRDLVSFPTVPLTFIKDLKNAANVAVSDVLMTAVSQAIHDYCQKHERLSSKSQCRAMLTIGFPTGLADKQTALRNKWCMASCDLGVHIDDILDRLAFVHAKTKEMKEDPRALLMLFLQNQLLPFLPYRLAQEVYLAMCARHSLSMTNVPGPTRACVLGGKEVQSLQLFYNNLHNHVDLISYGGQVYGNIIYDSAEMADFQDFGRYYGLALVRLALRLGVKVPLEVLEKLTS